MWRQRAARAWGDGGAQSQTVAKVMELAENAAVSDDSLLHIARKEAKAADSKVETKTLASRLAALRDYLNGGNVDWAEAHGFVLDMAQQIMEKSAKRNDALWKQYPELHEMGMSLEKGSKDYREVVYKYGSWAGATKELARHGVKLTLTKNGAVSRWDADFTELQGIGGGLLPTETPSSAADALEAMAAAHDAIRPTMENAYDTDWDAAKQEIAMQIWGEYLGLPGGGEREQCGAAQKVWPADEGDERGSQKARAGITGTGKLRGGEAAGTRPAEDGKALCGCDRESEGTLRRNRDKAAGEAWH